MEQEKSGSCLFGSRREVGAGLENRVEMQSLQSAIYFGHLANVSEDVD